VPGAHVTSKPMVYLAECSYELREDRDKIRGELRAHGYNVLPDPLARLPELESEYVAEVDRLLEQCQLSVHIVGRFRGKVPDGPSLKSAVELQNEIAAEQSKETGLHRVIWLPGGTGSEQVEQETFIKALQTVVELQRGADLVTTDLEALKGAIHTALSKLEETVTPNASSAPHGRLVHLICDERDRAATIPLRKFLKNEGLEVEIPLFAGDAATVRQANQNLLVRCDAVILFYGAADEAWKRTVESDLKKAKAYRDDKPLLGSYTYLAPPATDDKQELIELEERDLLNGLSGFPQAELKPLVDLLKA
jgi:hypothetical protein